MDSQSNFHLNQFPLEKEFHILALREKLNSLPRKDLEEYLIESLLLVSKLSHQLSQFKDYVNQGEG